MNAADLKRWKTRQIEDARTKAAQLRPTRPEQLFELYQAHFSLTGCFTTSLDPYTPVWALVPFFSKVIVGITPYLKTEDQFISWYGVTLTELLDLHRLGRVEIRVLFPSAATTIPRFLNVFFEEKFPSTAIDLAFDEEISGREAFRAAQERFASLASHSRSKESIDTFKDNPRRAFRTAQTVYTQLRVLGFLPAAEHFETLLSTNQESAYEWLEVCRLFLIGPIHYSLGGIHSVSSATRAIADRTRTRTHKFPSELGRALTKELGLLRRRRANHLNLSLSDCLAVYPDYEEARKVLLQLNKHLRSNNTSNEAADLSRFKELLVEAGQSHARHVWELELLGATSLAALTTPIAPIWGLLAALGFEIAAASQPAKETISSIADSMQQIAGQEHLTLLSRLSANVSRHFRDRK